MALCSLLNAIVWGILLICTGQGPLLYSERKDYNNNASLLLLIRSSKSLNISNLEVVNFIDGVTKEYRILLKVLEMSQNTSLSFLKPGLFQSLLLWQEMCTLFMNCFALLGLSG